MLEQLKQPLKIGIDGPADVLVQRRQKVTAACMVKSAGTMAP